MSRPRLSIVLCAALAVLGALAVPVSKARAETEADSRLQDVERRIEADRARQAALERRGKALTREVAALKRELVASAKATQSHEARLSRLEGRLKTLRRDEFAKRRTLERRRGDLGHTLAALQRLAAYPPKAAVALPGSARDTVRSALLLRTVIPHLETRAATLRRELAELGVLRGEISQQRHRVQRAGRALDSERRNLATLLARKAKLRRRTEAERRRVATRLDTLAAEAKTLRELIAGLEAESRAAEAVEPDGTTTEEAALMQPGGLRRFAEGRGLITLPVIGRMVRVFDQAARTGTYNKGIIIKVRPGAQVVAPYDGRVAFAGPFRGYGQILIIEHGGGYHTLLAGIRRIDSVVNQWLLAGEPVGVMGPSSSGPPTLYLEIRLNGQPIDPLPWLAINQARVNG
jgi:septal ring factor EnvC (AmiA/AmiB activator)